MKSLVRLACALCLSALLLGGCIPAPPVSRAVPATTPLRVCYSSVSAPQIALIYAQEKGLFARHGLDVELIYVDGGTEAATTLISGETDLCQVGGAPVANAVVAGEDLVLIAGLFNRYAYALMVTPDIASAEDLKGKALAVSSLGSSSDSALRTLLPSLGLEPDTDVAIVSIGNQSSRLAAMASGAIAGTLISVPESAKARDAGYRELANMQHLEIPYPHNAVATTRSFLNENRDAALRYLRAIIEAIALMKSNKDDTIAVMASFLQLDPAADRSALEEAYAVFVVDGLAAIPYSTVDGVQSHLDAMETENPNAASFGAADVIDDSLLAEIEGSGFLNQLTP